MGLFHDSSPATCPAFPTPLSDADPISTGGTLTISSLFLYISAACAAVSGLISLLLILIHATHFSNPVQQIYIIRISFVIPVFAIIGVLCAAFNSSAVYIKPWMDVYESIALVSFFFLLSEYAFPGQQGRGGLFMNLENVDNQRSMIPGGSLAGYRRTWFLIVQYPVAMTIMAVATDATEAAKVYCLTSNTVHFAHIWLTILRMISTAVAVIAILGFYKRINGTLKAYKILTKLIAFKLIVFLNFVQTALFNFLGGGHVHPTAKFSYYDLTVGLPSALICLEMIFIAIFFHYAYTAGPYKLFGERDFSRKTMGLSLSLYKTYQGGPLGIKAILMAMNPVDIIRGILIGLSNGISQSAASYSLSSEQSMEPLRGPRQY